MKAKKIILSIAVAILVFVSCDKIEFGNEFLEKEPSVDVTKDSIFRRYDLAFRYLAKGYSTLPYGLNLDWGAKDNKLGMDILEPMSDLCHTYLAWGGINQFYYNGQYSAAEENTTSKNHANTKYHYSKEDSWVGIRIGWTFVENANKIQNISEEERKKLIAEAKMIIAVHYVDMYRHFGGLPWVDHAFTPDESTVLPRQTSKETLKKIVALIDEAKKDLPWALTNVSSEDGRFTQASAMGLKARVLLFGASPLFNDDIPYLQANNTSDNELTWHGGKDPSLWGAAAAAAKELIDAVGSSGGYALVQPLSPTTDGYRKAFQDAYYKRGNGEILISTRARFKSGAYWATNYYFYQSAGGYGTACPTKEYVDMFPMANGTPITDINSGYNPNRDPWKNRDPRLYETILVNEDRFQGREAELWIGGRERTTLANNASKTGFGLKKFLLDRDAATSIQSIVQWPYLRLAEIYLTYAEAANEAEGAPSQLAYDAVNKVRARVGLNNLPPRLSQAEFREAVFTERALEFGFEEVRWFDIVRRKKFDIFKQQLHGVNTTRNPNGTYSYETVALPGRFWQNNWSPKWYLSAFPPNEVNKGSLTQNPGW